MAVKMKETQGSENRDESTFQPGGEDCFQAWSFQLSCKIAPQAPTSFLHLIVFYVPADWLQDQLEACFSENILKQTSSFRFFDTV